MTVKRIEWTCPHCEKRYAIPAHSPKPTLCPTCVNDTAEDEPAPVVEPHPTAIDEMPSFPSFEEPGPGTLPPVAPTEHPHRSRRMEKRYPALRVISLCYKALSVVAFLIGCASLIFSVYAAIVNEANAGRTALILTGIYVFLCCLMGAITLRALGELIQVAIDIESNTRRQSSEDD